MPKGPLVFQSDVIWFPSEIRRLLRAIEKHPGLFDPRNELFGIREKNNIMWGAVAKLVGGNKTDVQCRDKWTCLRGTYRRHVRTELTNSVRRRSNWPWVEEMSFMRNYILDKEEMAEAQLLGKKVKPSTRSRSTDNSETESKSVEQPQPQTQHQTNCPKSVPSTSGNMPFTGIIYSMQPKGIRCMSLMPQGNQSTNVRMSLVPQGNQSANVRLIQPNPTNLRLVQPNQTNVSLSLLRTTQPTLRFVQASQGSNGVATVTEQVDLSKVKPDPDTLDNTEFIDMNTVIKKEPMDTDGEEHTSDHYNFLSEDPSGISEIANVDETEHSSQDGSRKPDSDRSNQSSPKLTEDGVNDSNQLFMSSVLANLRKLTPYDQSMFKLKVLQILHEMMFPKK